MTFSSFALRYHKDIDHRLINHLKDVCEMCRRSLNHFSWINIVPRGVDVDVNVNFDTWTAWKRQRCGCLFLRQNVRVVNLSITHDYLVPSLSFWGLLEIRTQTWHPWRQISVLIYASLMVLLHKVWDSFKTWYCEYFLLITFNIITRNYCLNKAILILAVAFLLSVSIYMYFSVIYKYIQIIYPFSRGYKMLQVASCSSKLVAF